MGAGLERKPQPVRYRTDPIAHPQRPGPGERCYHAWHNHRPIFLEYREADGLESAAPIVAARTLEVDEGQMLFLWVRLADDEVELEFSYGDEFDDEFDDDYEDDYGEDPGFLDL